jgi:tetratricopeptide (TPR) repeat protein
VAIDRKRCSLHALVPKLGRIRRTRCVPALVGLGVFGLLWGMTLRWPDRRNTPVSAVHPATARALMACEQKLSRARQQMVLSSRDARAALRVASLERRRVDLLALAAYEQEHRNLTEISEIALAADPAWRQRFLRSDPERALTRAARTVESALNGTLDTAARRHGLLVLAGLRADLGDHAREAEALQQAVYLEPDQPALWLRLAEAWGRTREFARAEAARAQALALLEGDAAPPGSEAPAGEK